MGGAYPPSSFILEKSPREKKSKPAIRNDPLDSVYSLRVFQLLAKMAEVGHASACFMNLIDSLTS